MKLRRCGLMWASKQFEAFDDANYIYEPAWDGLRVLLHKEGRHLQVMTPSGRFIHDKFPELADAHLAVQAHSAVLDGCIIPQGRSSMPRELVRSRANLANEKRIKRAAYEMPVRFVAFDVLSLSAQDLAKHSLASRKFSLDMLVSPNSILRTGMYVRESGKSLFAQCERQGAVGIVAKKASSIYQQGKVSADWIQVNQWRTMNVVVMGYRVSPKFGVMVGLPKTGFDGRQSAKAYQTLGWVEDGFTDAERLAFLSVASEFVQEMNDTMAWVKPEVCCTIHFQPGRGRRPMMDAIFAGFAFEFKPYDCDGRVLPGGLLGSAPQGHANERKNHDERQRSILQQVHHGV